MEIFDQVQPDPTVDLAAEGTARLRSFGYRVSALELTDPDDTPKNTLIKAIKAEKLLEYLLAQKRTLLAKMFI